tara:strand:- start:314 stop:1195 length:882 start_codon:yes stop_codon:yes gene_type:complete
MKTIFNYLLTPLFILTIFLPKNVMSQDNDALWGALAIGAATAIAIEDNQEMLEAVASNYIFSNYPEYNEFRLKIIGWGDGGKRMSDRGGMRFYPFSIIQLENNTETANRKLLLLFASPGWVNEYGLDYTKLSWELWNVQDWNKLLSIFSELNSPINMPIESNVIPVFKKINKGLNSRQLLSSKENNSESIFISGVGKGSSKDLFYEYIQDEKESTESISKLKFTKEGWKLKNKVIYPFYSLKGDDYIITDYSESLRVFSNEDALGLFLKKEKDQMLVKFSIINKIHKFINTQE